MVNMSVSVACFLLATSFNNRRGYAKMPTNLYRSNFNICTIPWLISLFLASQGIITKQIIPINMVYPKVNKSVSLACFILATSFNSGCGYAETFTNHYCTNFNIFTNYWPVSSFFQVRRDHHNVIYPIKMVYPMVNMNISLG